MSYATSTAFSHLLKVVLIVQQKAQQLILTSGKNPENYYLFYKMFEPGLSLKKYQLN